MYMNSNHLRNKRMMIKSLKKNNIITFVVIVVLVFSSCKDKSKLYNGEVYRVSENMFGYKVFYKGEIYIKQEFIPCIYGNKSFTDSIDASRVLDLVLKNLNNGKSPSINEQDLIKLNIINNN